MIPRSDEPGGTPRRFSAEVETRLLDALLECEERVSSSSAVKLQRALHDAALDARENSLRVEELVIAFKQVEDRVLQKARPQTDLRASRVRIIRSLLEAYYR